MYIMCPAPAAGKQEGTGVQHVCVVLAEVRSAKGDRSQRWRLVPKASPCPCVPGMPCFVLTHYFNLRSQGAGGRFGSEPGL